MEEKKSLCYFSRMYERDEAIEKEVDTVLQTTLEHVLTQGF